MPKKRAWVDWKKYGGPYKKWKTPYNSYNKYNKDSEEECQDTEESEEEEKYSPLRKGDRSTNSYGHIKMKTQQRERHKSTHPSEYQPLSQSQSRAFGGPLTRQTPVTPISELCTGHLSSSDKDWVLQQLTCQTQQVQTIITQNKKCSHGESCLSGQQLMCLLDRTKVAQKLCENCKAEINSIWSLYPSRELKHTGYSKCSSSLNGNNKKEETGDTTEELTDEEKDEIDEEVKKILNKEKN